MSESTISFEVYGFKTWYRKAFKLYNCYKLQKIQWIILNKSLIEKQVALVVDTTSEATHVDAGQAGLCIFVIELLPQTKEFGKSIPGNLPERQA